MSLLFYSLGKARQSKEQEVTIKNIIQYTKKDQLCTVAYESF